MSRMGHFGEVKPRGREGALSAGKVETSFLGGRRPIALSATWPLVRLDLTQSGVRLGQTISPAGSGHAYLRAAGDPLSRLGTPPGGCTRRRPVAVPPRAW